MNVFKKSQPAVHATSSMVFATVVVLLLSLGFTPVVLAEGIIQLPCTGQTISYAAGDDGDLQIGVAWPDPRFSDHEDGTATDHLTGLMWVTDANLMASRDPDFDTDGAQDGSVNWETAMAYVEKLNTDRYAGHNDWRLPNILELNSLVDASQGDPAFSAGHPFDNAPYALWSSTGHARDKDRCWFLRLDSGEMHLSFNDPDGSLELVIYGVLPVRTSGISGVIQLPATGLSRTWRTGDDGHRRQGVAWPSPRYNDHGDGSITDRLTGLMWSREGNLVFARDPDFPGNVRGGGYVSWSSASEYLSKINTERFLGYSDWRLPNRSEGISLSDFGSDLGAYLSRGHPFVNVGWRNMGSTQVANLLPDWATWNLFGIVNVGLSVICPVRSDDSPVGRGEIAGSITANGVGLVRTLLMVTGPVTGAAFPEPNGDFLLNFLPPGEYTLTPSHEYYEFAPSERTVTVTDGLLTGADFDATLAVELGWVDWSHRIPDEFEDYGFSFVHFVSPDEGWIGGLVGGVLHTTDGGKNWTMQGVPVNSGQSHFVNDLWMRNAEEGWLVNRSGEIFHTTNGGEEWVLHAEPGGGLISIHFPPEGEIGYACGNNGKIIQITAGGVENLTVEGLTATLQSIMFPVSSEEGKLCGESTIRRFLDGTWNNLQIFDSTYVYNDIWFVGNDLGWTVGSQGQIRHASDSITWNGQTNPLPNRPSAGQATLNGVHFIDAHDGWIVGDEGSILHTIDGGADWVQQADGLSASALSAVFGVNEETAYAVGNDGTFLKYTRLEPPIAYTGPLTITGLSRTPDPDIVTLTWEPASSQATLEFSSDLKTWQPLAEDLTGTSWTGAVPGGGCLRLRWEVGEP